MREIDPWQRASHLDAAVLVLVLAVAVAVVEVEEGRQWQWPTLYEQLEGGAH